MSINSIKTKTQYSCIIILFVFFVAGINSKCLGGSAESFIANAKKSESKAQYPEAINEYFKAINREPSYPYSYYYLGIISDVVLNDYYTSALFYEKALSLLKFKDIFISEGLLDDYKDENRKKHDDIGQSSLEKAKSVIADIESRKAVLIENVFSSIENPVYPIYIVLKPKKSVYPAPNISGKSIPVEDLMWQNEFKYLSFKDNRYRVELQSGNDGWVKWKDINLIYQNKTRPVRLSKLEKANAYEDFAKKFSSNALSEDAKYKMDTLYYEIATERDQIDDYNVYLSKCPDGKFVNEAKGRIVQIQKNVEKTQKLEKLEDLYNKGLIDEKKYIKKKNKISKE